MLFYPFALRVSGYAVIVAVALSVGLGIGLLISFAPQKNSFRPNPALFCSESAFFVITPV